MGLIILDIEPGQGIQVIVIVTMVILVNEGAGIRKRRILFHGALHHLRVPIRRKRQLDVIEHLINPEDSIVAKPPFHLACSLPEKGVKVVDKDLPGLLDDPERKRLQDGFQNLAGRLGFPVLIIEVFLVYIYLLECDGRVGIVVDLRADELLCLKAIEATKAKAVGDHRLDAHTARIGPVKAVQAGKVREGQLHVIAVRVRIGLLIEFRIQKAGPIQGPVPVNFDDDFTDLHRV